MLDQPRAVCAQVQGRQAQLVQQLTMGSELGYEEATTNLAWIMEGAIEQRHLERSWRRLPAALGRWVSRWMSLQHRFMLHNGGGVAALLANTHQSATQAPGWETRLAHETMKLHSTAALQGSRHSALRAGDYHFFGGYGGAVEPSLVNHTAAAEFYRLSGSGNGPWRARYNVAFMTEHGFGREPPRPWAAAQQYGTLFADSLAGPQKSWAAAAASSIGLMRSSLKATMHFFGR